MIKRRCLLVACTLMLASTVSAQTDYRQALRLAFPATVSVSTTEGNQAVPPLGR